MAASHTVPLARVLPRRLAEKAKVLSFSRKNFAAALETSQMPLLAPAHHKKLCPTEPSTEPAADRSAPSLELVIAGPTGLSPFRITKPRSKRRRKRTEGAH